MFIIIKSQHDPGHAVCISPPMQNRETHEITLNKIDHTLPGLKSGQQLNPDQPEQ